MVFCAKIMHVNKMKDKMKELQYIYGPVFSWRLGVSLGLDLLSAQKKICNFDCIYCQLGKTRKYSTERKVYVPTELIIDELINFPRQKIDYITFSGRGEPTLARNLGETIQAVRKLRKEPIAVLTNSTLLSEKIVRDELGMADFIIAKLDAFSVASLKEINRPAKGINFRRILESIKIFKSQYAGRLGLQIMFIAQNSKNTHDFLRLCREIQPDEIEINTPLRPSQIRPLIKSKLLLIKQQFSPFKNVCVYECLPQNIIPVDKRQTLLRRSKNK
jgi:wyosine [tRNA(Phe)-imidazoG37] synthetase (radical SAM superfamily)